MKSSRAGFVKAAFIAVSLLLPATVISGPAWAQTAPPGPTKATTLELSLIVGENKPLPTPAHEIASYTLGVKGVAEAKLSPDNSLLLIVGLTPGSTTIFALLKNGSQVTYNITVYQRAPQSVEKELEQLLVGYVGLRLRKVGTRFFIEGGVSTEADAKRVQLIASLYPGQVESLVVVGSVGQEHTINVRVDFYFVQYDKNSSYGVGISYPGRFGGGTFGLTQNLVQNQTTATLTMSQSLPALDLAQVRGWAKVLKHSAVVTTSGSEATFENGGEQNVAVATGVTSSVHPIKFGTNVSVLPRYDALTKDVEVKVKADVSDLTPGAGSGSPPGRKTSNVTTFVHLKLGQALVLSGIRTSSETHSVAGLPLLSQIPVLGVLFGGHANAEEEIEGAVFIIPSVVESVPRKAHDVVESAMTNYENYSGSIENVRSFSKDPPAYR